MTESEILTTWNDRNDPKYCGHLSKKNQTQDKTSSDISLLTLGEKAEKGSEKRYWQHQLK